MINLHPIHGGPPTWLFRAAIVTWGALFVALAIKGFVSPVNHNSYLAFESGVKFYWADVNVYNHTFNEFRYGPSFAVAFTPLTSLTSRLGSPLWMLLNAGLFFWSLRVLVRDILPAEWTADREGLFLLVSLAASLRGMWSAQTNPLIFACVVAAMSAVLHRRWNWAAFFLAVPVHIKIWPIAAALLIIACWPRHLVGRFAVALAGIAALPLLTKWPSIVLERYVDWYWAIVGPMQVRHSYRDMWTLWEFIQQPVDPLAYALLQISTALLVFGLCLGQRQSATAAQLMTFVLGAWTAWQLAFGPGSERNTFGLIGPITAWAVLTCFTTGKWRDRVVVLAAMVLMLGASHGHLERGLEPAFPFVTAAHPIGVLILFGWLIVYARHWGRSGIQDQPERALREFRSGWASAA